jgi:molybdopterin-guanine dinucleotide biosynthesis protein A
MGAPHPLLPFLYDELKKGVQLLLLRDENHRATEHVFDSPDTMNEEPVQLVITAVDSGISLAKVEFQPDLESDESILSGLLTALRYISDMIFWSSFDEMRFGKYTMLMKVESPFLFCYIFKGLTNHAIHRLDEFIKIIREKDSLLKSLKNTISTGAVDKITKSSVMNIATQIFTHSGCQLWRN